MPCPPAACPNGDNIHVDAFAVTVDPIEHRLEEPPGEVEWVAVGQVTSMGKVHGEIRVARFEQSHQDSHVGLAAGVRLRVGPFSAEELFRTVTGQSFDRVDVIATAVVAPARVALRVFIGQDRPDSLANRERGRVLGGDQFELGVLAPTFRRDGLLIGSMPA